MSPIPQFEEASVSFTRTQSDFAESVQIVSKQIYPAWRRWYIAIAWPVSSVMGVLLYWGVMENQWYVTRQDFLLGMFAYLSSYVFVCLLPRFQKPTFVSPTGSFCRPQTLSVSDESLTLKSGDAETEIPWPFVMGVKHGKKGFLILMDEADGIYVPNRAFETEEGRDLFIASINHRITAEK